jgi:hypothetical protein
MQREHSCPTFACGGQGGSKIQPEAIPSTERAGPRNGDGGSVNLTLTAPSETVEKQVTFSLFPIL